MPVIRSLVARRWPELAWAAFAAANIGVMLLLQSWQTVPFHFVWVSLTILYGYRVWSPRATAAVLVVVGVTTGYALLHAALDSGHGIDEMTEVPLMSAMFVAMVWHARRRDAAMSEVRAAAEREREFIRDASHLLRTPITVARGHAELIAVTAEGQAGHDVAVIVEELQRLSRISDRLLVLASAEHPRFTSVRPVSLPSLVAATVRRWSVAAADREWACEAPAAGSVRADEERLLAALDAVVENAVKATRPGDRIVVRGLCDGAEAVVEVVDGGIGIAPEALPRIFERFARQPHPGGGTGLGMPIVKAIVEAHGGKVDVASAPGKGTSVRLRLPGFAPA
ncbi:MAG TPA: HAMP domain-containing sensor histidine kinase [Solirubrobacteraceae bacterium]|jgi:signal transduction histidine kinase